LGLRWPLRRRPKPPRRRRALPETVAPAAAKTASRGQAKGSAQAKERAQPKEPPLPAPQGKFAVFTFSGEGAHRVQQQVISSLRAKGLKVITNLRPVDSAEQYREMAATLNLVALRRRRVPGRRRSGERDGLRP
jgi:hypothetical protein